MVVVGGDNDSAGSTDSADIDVRALLDRPKLFKDASSLGEDYIPSKLQGRKRQLEQIVEMLANAESGGNPSNCIIYGLKGSGKTAAVSRVFQLLRALKWPVLFHFINCRQNHTYTAIVNSIQQAFANHLGKSDFRPVNTGLTREAQMSILVGMLREVKGAGVPVVVVALDEIDCLRDNDLLYTLLRLCRINEGLDRTYLTLIGITNDTSYVSRMDPGLRESFGAGTHLLFPPYNAVQLQDILKERAAVAFNDGALSLEVLPWIAAKCAVDGSARLAILWLKTAAETAQRQQAPQVTLEHATVAIDTMTSDVALDTVKTLPYRQALVLLAVVELAKSDAYANRAIPSRMIFDKFRGYDQDSRLFEYRWTTNVIRDLDRWGILELQLHYRAGGKGRTNEISLRLPPDSILEALEHSDGGLTYQHIIDRIRYPQLQRDPKNKQSRWIP